MKKRYIHILTVSLLGISLFSCAPTKNNRRITVRPVTTLTPGYDSKVNVDVTFHIPEKAVSKRSRLIVTPQLTHADSTLQVFSPIVLDASIYRKKTERKKELEEFVDTLADKAVKIDRKKACDIPFVQTITLPSDLNGGKIVAVVSNDGCGVCEGIDMLDMAYISNIPSLIEPAECFRTKWNEHVYEIKPKEIKGRGEALLQFIINRYDINLSLGNNKTEMENMLAVMKKITTDSLATINHIDIYGLASADGSFAFNTTLSRNRANSAKNWLVAQLHLDKETVKRFTVASRPEGWEPVLKAMTDDGYPDSLQVKNILEKYKDHNDDVAEYFIRRLPCWKDIRENYLQKDRKVEYEYFYTIKNFTTDEELLDMYGKRPDAFSLAEFLRVATLQQSDEAKMEVYEKTLSFYPDATDAANNLAILHLKHGNISEAEAVASTQNDNSSEELCNTKAAIAIAKGEYEKADSLLNGLDHLPQARYNMALVKAHFRQLEEAYQLIKDEADINTVLLALSTDRMTEAEAALLQCDDGSPLACYAKAIIAARRQDTIGVFENLRKAAVDKTLQERMKTETDFIPYFDTVEFRAITYGGSDNE